MSRIAWPLGLAQVPLAQRVALASSVFALLVGVLAAGSGYWALSRQLDRRLAGELQGKVELVRHLLSEMRSVDDVPASAHRFGDLLIGHHDLHLALIDPGSGGLLASFSQAAGQSITRLAGQAEHTALRWQGRDGSWFESLKGAGAAKNGQSIVYVLSVELQADQVLLAAYRRATLVALPAILLLVAAGAWLVVRAGLGPLKSFTRKAASITPNTLNQRLPRQRLPAEIADLADGFNAMLSRIDEGVTRLSEFSADLAHEMRTPVATLLGRSQVALSRERTAEELRDVLVVNVEELERLTRLIADMLFLARADQGDAPLERTAIDLAAEARRVAEFLAWVAEERSLRFHVEGEATAAVDQMLVQRAITNLLSNAMRHASPGGVIDVRLSCADGCARISVQNAGDTIPPDQKDRIFERLVRLDAARARADGGSGLGLAIVSSIMRLHGGCVRVDSEHGRTEFVLMFPTGTADPAVPGAPQAHHGAG